MAKTWKDKQPADMSLEELQDARTSLQHRYNALQNEMGWIGNALNHLSSEVGKRYELPLAGQPDAASLPTYPTDQVAGFDPAATPEVLDTATSTGPAANPA